jgi:proteasome accessory factor C
MADTAAAQLRRVLHLIPRLADGEDHALADVAKSAGTTPAELLSDFISISDRFDAPGGFVEGVSIMVETGIVSVHASHFHRPMRLTMPELCALELGLMMLRQERTPVEQAPIDRALERLRLTISNVPANDHHEGMRYADLANAGSAEHLGLLRSAVREHRKVSLRYRSGGARESTTRTICPHSLAHAEPMWYVVATSDDDTVRFFRLDRVESVELLADTFQPDEGVVAGVMESGRAFESRSQHRMTVRYSARIAPWVAERAGKKVAADGSLTLEHQVADESWAVRHVLQYGPKAELLAPPELRQRVLDRLDPLHRRV